MKHLLPVVLLVALLGLSACGGDDDGDEGSSAKTDSSKPATAQKPPCAPKDAAEPEAPPKEPGPVGEGEAGLRAVQKRLTDAGYAEGPASGLPDFALGLVVVEDGPLVVSVYSYRSNTNLSGGKRNLTRFERTAPERVELAVCPPGKRIYVGVVQPPGKLDAAQFRKVVAAGEGTNPEP